ncbi:MAG: ABC transporter permease, partial [Planctomycetes bacterium]|nr:ABC transporter permease [Planctomycetota bacterium]
MGGMVPEPIVRTPRSRSFFAFLNPWAMVCNLWAHRQLTWQLAQREIVIRYRGSYLGLLWSVLTPLVLLGIYTFAFAVVFNIRWGDDPNESRGQFALTMFCGMLLYNLFAEVVNRAPSLVVGNANFVKRVVFPLEVLVLTGLLSALVNMLIGYGVWAIGWVLMYKSWVPITALYFPLVLVPVLLTTVGIAWLLASLGAFLRDIGPAVMLFTQMLFFATPIFYSIDRVPMPFRRVLELNPLTHAIEGVRRVLMSGGQPDWLSWAFATAVGMVL